MFTGVDETIRDIGLFKLVADHAPAMLWMTDADGQATFLNKLWLEFTGRTEAQELGVGWMEGVHPDDSAAVVEHYSRALELKQSFELAYRLRRADGEYRHMLDRGVPRHDENHVLLGYVGAVFDVTEQSRFRLLADHAQDMIYRYRV